MTERQMRIHNYLSNNPMATTSEIAKATGLDVQQARQSLNGLYAAGRVARQFPLSDSPRGTATTRWQLETAWA